MHSEACIGQKKSVYEGTNAVPRSGDPGRVLHLGLTDGELANRVIVVGHHTRADLLSGFLEAEDSGSVFKLASDRGFLTYTGQFAGERLSVVSIGMGLAMMDFFLREARAVVKGPMAVVRLGTCGCLQEHVKVGNVSVADGSALVQRNYSGLTVQPSLRQPKPSTCTLAQLMRTKKINESYNKIYIAYNVYREIPKKEYREET
ncbi:Purine nucleoside phosphorylase (PNP) (5'-methylthioadenosine phosphorylase I) (MTA phosphorylase I) (MTAPI) [Durusdinium trenchii]|uniref:Purine nucleoside phosphorylase (PNP) (5'-methylthioadenosine phosphorylase I) (MTA phosphorylase I) (MTAPI) n=1 Tax=Durusdinium trenchii TaxID=1381693 RepID=A0ABP0LGJ6_9DINO